MQRTRSGPLDPSACRIIVYHFERAAAQRGFQRFPPPFGTRVEEVFQEGRVHTELVKDLELILRVVTRTTRRSPAGEVVATLGRNASRRSVDWWCQSFLLNSTSITACSIRMRIGLTSAS